MRVMPAQHDLRVRGIELDREARLHRLGVVGPHPEHAPGCRPPPSGRPCTPAGISSSRCRSASAARAPRARRPTTAAAPDPSRSSSARAAAPTPSVSWKATLACRSQNTGSSTPSSRPTRLTNGPAAFTKRGVPIVRVAARARSPRTPRTRPPAVSTRPPAPRSGARPSRAPARACTCRAAGR